MDGATQSWAVDFQNHKPKENSLLPKALLLDVCYGDEKLIKVE